MNVFCLTIKSVFNLECVQEYRFHPVRRWRFDYCIPSKMIAIEVEGGAWSNGRHTRGKGFISDMEKYNTAVCQGWKLIRVTPDGLMTKETLDYLRLLIE